MSTGNNYLTDSMLKAIMPRLSSAKRRKYLPFLNMSMAYFGINTERRIAMYLAQLAHESVDLTRWQESLYYSAARLRAVWPRRFNTWAKAKAYAKNPKKLANYTYGHRMGNRGRNTNDGWDYRGQGPIMATGRGMYIAIRNAKFPERFEGDPVKNPGLMLQTEFGLFASAWIFAVEKKCLGPADRGDIRTCTKRINGGYIGLKDRIHNYRVARRVIPDGFKLKSYEDFETEMFRTPEVIQNEVEEIFASPAILENAVNTDNHEQNAIAPEVMEAIARDPENAEAILDPNSEDEHLVDKDEAAELIENRLIEVTPEKTETEILAEKAKDMEDYEHPHQEKTGVMGKIYRFIGGIFGGSLVLPPFMENILGMGLKEWQVDLIKTALPYVIVGGIAAFVIWFVTKEIRRYGVFKTSTAINTDPTRGNVKNKEKEISEKTGIMGRFSAISGMFNSVPFFLGVLTIFCVYFLIN